MNSPFPQGWWSFDLGRYRKCSGTYALYSYQSVPPLDAGMFSGEFEWLAAAGRGRAVKPLVGLIEAAAAVGVTLPPAFLRFMGDSRLRDAVPSCTACEWDVSDAPVASLVVPGAFTVRFLRDQQDCLFWYLHVLPDGATQVLCSPIPFDSPRVMEKVTPAVVLKNTWVCAPEFEQFVYRFWIENELWDKLSGREPQAMSEAERVYIGHYGPPPKVPAVAVAEPTAEKAAVKKTAKKAVKKTAAKKTAKKAAVKKTAKKTAVKKTAKKAAVKKTAKKAAVKKTAKKAAAEKVTKKTAKNKGAASRKVRA